MPGSRSPWPPSMCWSSGMVYSPTRRVSCPSRWLSLVCKIPVLLFGLSETNTIDFYALHYVPLARKNFGGVKTNLRCQVLDKHYEPIPGLYAAGELTGMAGGHINGKAGLEGTMLGPALFSGRVGGAWAACEAGYGKGFVGKAYHR